MNVVHRHYTIKYNNPNKLRLPSIKKDEQISKKETNDDLTILLKDENIIDKKKEKEDKKDNEKIDEDPKNKIEENKDIFFIPENITDDELNKIKIDSFFETNNVTLTYLQNKYNEVKSTTKNNSINSAMRDFLNMLIKDIQEGKEEIYSSKKMINYMKLMILNWEKEENKEKFQETAQEKIINIKNNYNLITKFIDDIFSKLKENITTIPVIIKCILNIIEQLLNKKYIERKATKLITNYQKYIFKSNIFFGNFVLSSLKNLDFNGIFVSDIISKTTFENLNIIINIFDKMLSGKLFSNCPEVLYNSYIIETLPKFFEIIDSVEKNFKLPDVLQRLVNTYTDIKNTKREQDFEYDYFFEKNEEIQYQSLCFDLDNLLILMKLAKKNIEELNNYSEEEKLIIGKIYGYENFLVDLNKKNRTNEKKCEFFYMVKINFNTKTDKRINSILRDDFTVINQTQNINTVSFMKKCLIEVLEYAAVINKYNFIYFIQNLKRDIYNHDINKFLFRKNRQLEYENIINENNKNFEINEEEFMENSLNFNKVLIHNILEFLKLEIGTNYNDLLYKYSIHLNFSKLLA